MYYRGKKGEKLLTIADHRAQDLTLQFTRETLLLNRSFKLNNYSLINSYSLYRDKNVDKRTAVDISTQICIFVLPFNYVYNFVENLHNNIRM